MQQLEQLIKERKFRKDFIYMCHRHKENNISLILYSKYNKSDNSFKS